MVNASCPEGGSPANPTPLLVLPVLVSLVWITFQLLYWPSVLGFLVTRLTNLFLRESGIHIGALHFNILTGRLLIKDVNYYCRDYSIRVTDGYISLRWWRKCGKNECTRCSSTTKGAIQSRPAFVFFQLNGFELHWYNRSDVYDSWGKVRTDEAVDTEESAFWRWWEKSQPSIHFSITKGRIVLGNHLVERSVGVYFDKTEAHYSTKEASNPYDELMHMVSMHGTNPRIVLEPSTGYHGDRDQQSPPVLCEGMKDAYLVLKSDTAVCTYSWDSPGLVPLGDDKGPRYAFDVQLGNHTAINYGTFAHRQRDKLVKFLFPNDYTERPVTSYPGPGEKRIYTHFDVSVKLNSLARVNFLFRDKETPQFIAADLGGGSSVSISIPWTTDEDGYHTFISGSLSEVAIFTSLAYPGLGSAGCVSFSTDLHYPRLWNCTQKWDMKFDGSVVQVSILFAYIDFVNALLDDWLGEESSDLLSFVPVDWNIVINLSQYEIFLHTNRYNWVDLAKDGVENTRLAFCGTAGQLTFRLPFTEYLPPDQTITFTANGQNLVVRHYVPPSSTSRESLLALSSINKHRWRVMECHDDQHPPGDDSPSRRDRSLKSTSSSPAISHSKAGGASKNSLTDSEKESKLLTHVISAPVLTSRTSAAPLLTASSEQSVHDESTAPERASRADSVATDHQGDSKTTPHEGGGGGGRGEEEEDEEFESTELFPMGYRNVTSQDSGWLDLACGPSIAISITYHSRAHDPSPGQHTELRPNDLLVDIEAPVVMLRVFGCLARDLLALKENYPGEFINFKVFNSTVPDPPPDIQRAPPPRLAEAPPPCPPDLPSEPNERSLNVTVDFKLRSITAEFPTHLPEGYPRDFPLPSGRTDLFSVHVDYVAHETRVLLHVDPVTVHLPSMVPSPGSGVADDAGYELGHLACTGFAFSCHGLTDYLCQERVEYGWMMQLQVGRITGAVSSQQLLQVLDWFQVVFIHTVSHGDGFREAPGAELIQPMVDPISEEIKYRLFDLSILEADVSITEGSTLTRLQSHGFDLGMCTLHQNAETLGLSLQLQGLTASCYAPTQQDPSCLLECGTLDVGNIQGDLTLREVFECVPARQLEFLRKADDRTRRLWFLWSEDSSQEVRCGCCGGCVFLDSSVERLPIREKLESSVYTSQPPISSSSALGKQTDSVTSSMVQALHSLKRSLANSGVKEVECVESIHKGLLEHYSMRYSQFPGVELRAAKDDERLTPSTETNRHSYISDGSFVSAHASLTSLLETEEEQFVSMENIDETGLTSKAGSEERNASTRHKKKPSALSVDLKAMAATGKGTEEVDGSFTDPLSTTDTYKDLMAGQTLKSVVLHIPFKKKKPEEPVVTSFPAHPLLRGQRSIDEHSLGERSSGLFHPLLQSQRSVDDRSTGERLSGLYYPFMQQQQQQQRPGGEERSSGGERSSGLVLHERLASDRSSGLFHRPLLQHQRSDASVRYEHLSESGSYIHPVQPKSSKPVSRQSSIVRNGLRLRIPILAPQSSGCLPAVVQGGSSRPLERKQRRVGVVNVGDEDKFAMLSLSVSINGSLSLTVSPPILGFAEKLISSVGGYVEGRSATAILDVLSNDSHGSIKAHIAKILKEKSFSLPPAPSHPLLHLSVTMAPTAFAAVQLVQAPRDSSGLRDKPRPPSRSMQLCELAKHSSLVTLYLTGLGCTALLYTASEIQQAALNRSRVAEGEQIEATEKCKSLLSSYKLSAELKCPVIQAAVCALVPAEADGKESTLPGLSALQSQLSFHYALPASQGGGCNCPEMEVRDLLEAGIREASVSCVANFVHSELSEEVVLTWRNIQDYELTNETTRPSSEDYEMSNNKVVVKALVPSLWSQLAAPHTGIACHSTGGLDVLVVVEAVEAWQGSVERLVKLATSVVQRKALREKRVILTLLNNATRSSLYHKTSNPLHTETSQTLRETVVYSCVHQLWKTLPLFQESLVPVLPSHRTECDEEIVASTLALATRLFSPKEQTTLKKKKYLKELAAREKQTSLSSAPKPSTAADNSDVDSVGYVSISPAPSDLAVPNLLVSSCLNLDEIDSTMVFDNIHFTSMVVLRESLLLFLLCAGVKVGPQLRTLCHNSAEYFADFSVELKEALVFVSNTVPRDAKIAPQQTDTPAVLLEHISLNGCVKYSTESANANSPYLSLLLQNTDPALLLFPSKPTVNVSCNCSISVDGITANLSAPFLKLGRHITETARFRALVRKATLADSLVTPKPPTEVTAEFVEGEGIDEVDSPMHAAASNSMWHFVQNLISNLREIEQATLPALTHTAAAVATGALTPTSTGGGFSNVKITEFSHSPKYPRSSQIQPPRQHQLDSKLSLPVLDLTSDSSARESRQQRPLKSSHGRKRHLSTSSNSLASSGDDAVAIEVDGLVPGSSPPVSGLHLVATTSPEEIVSTQDTYGGDTTDSPNVLSSDNEGGQSMDRSRAESLLSPEARIPAFPSVVPSKDQTFPVSRSLALAETELLFSVFGLLKIGSVTFNFQIETTKASLKLGEISGSVDARKAAAVPSLLSPLKTHATATDDLEKPFLQESLPTYLSLAATVKKTLLKIDELGLSDIELARFSALPIYCSIGICNSNIQAVPTYRCLLKMSGVELDMKQSPVIVHKRYLHLMPAFRKIYYDLFSGSSEMDASLFTTSSSSSSPPPPPPTTRSLADLKLPSKLPQGFIHFSLDQTVLLMTPLPSLTVTYNLAPVSVHVETASHISFQLLVGDHTLRFNPKEQHKGELSLRSLSLPTLQLTGEVKRAAVTKLPRVSLELAIKQVNVDLTTDVLNQLLILQNSFIKELNDLLQLFTTIGEAIPQRQRLQKPPPPAAADPALLSQPDTYDQVVSLLDSCKFSLAGVIITISTPLATAIRFSTGKIDMHFFKNRAIASSDASAAPAAGGSSQFSLLGRVEILISLALGYLLHHPDVVDDFSELAYFRTRISVRNTQENIQSSSLPRGSNGSSGGGGSGGREGVDSPVVMDTFLISILSPHLYIQTTAVEQAILFWLNVKSVYSFWQNERKQLTSEVQKATEAIIEKLHRPAQLQSSTIDFSKPRLVQITVSDVGICMPLLPLASTPHSAHSQTSFPALVATIKDMQFLLNFRGKMAATGKFNSFCIRFANPFSIRQKTWTMDPKRHKFTNCGTIHHGTFRLCLDSQNMKSGSTSNVDAGEKLVVAFQWDMSGIDFNANTEIGRHTSTMVRTMTAISSDLEGRHTKPARKSKATTPSPKPQTARQTAGRRGGGARQVHRRATSVGFTSNQGNETYTAALEHDLALQTKKLQKLRSSGATGDSLKSEEERLRRTEQELARTVHRMFRHPAEIKLHQLNQIFAPRSIKTSGSTPVKDRTTGSMTHKITNAMKRQLFSLSEEPKSGDELERPGSAQDSAEQPSSKLQLRERARSLTSVRPKHRRFISDTTALVASRHTPTPPTTDEDSSAFELESSYEGGGGGGASTDPATPTLDGEKRLGSEGGEEEEEGQGFQLPSIDVEVNVTINVDHGVIVLRTDDSSEKQEPGGLHSRPSLPLSHESSPYLQRRPTEPSPYLHKRSTEHLRPKLSSSIETVLLIPALRVKCHYQSIVGRSYSNAPIPSPIKGLTPPTVRLKRDVFQFQPEAKRMVESVHPSSSSSECPLKRGVFSLSAVVTSLPEDIQLTPSLLEFIEQVVRPTIAATVVTDSSSSSSSESVPAEVESEVLLATEPPPSDSWPISFPVDVTLAFQIQPSTINLSCQPHARVNCVIRSPDVNFVISFSLFTRQKREHSFLPESSSHCSTHSESSSQAIVPFNNLYITGCLTAFVLQLYSPQVSTLKQATGLASSEKREALSLTLGQALVHLSRETVLAPSTRTKATRSVDDYHLHSKLQVSVLTDIASVVLGYDMRRLNDITTFRRYWYRTSLVEALFIGSNKPDEASPEAPSGGSSEEESSAEPSAVVDLDDTISAAIVVHARVADVRVAANVAPVMGNVNLLVTHLKCEVHADVSHNELVLVQLDGQMEKGEVEARGGVIAGSILMQNLEAHVLTDSQSGTIPEHKARLSAELLEGRVDYMSACIILLRATFINATVYDTWEGLHLASREGEGEEDAQHLYASSIQVMADFTWTGLQVAINRSTTKNMFNIVQKMHEFIVQQKRRSERTISIMLPAGTAASRAMHAYRLEQKRAEEAKAKVTTKTDTRHHWLWAMKVGSRELMRTLGIHTPEDGQNDVSLGGRITIAGGNICVVCFHGPSFRETEWAVFNIDQVEAGFSTQAIPGLGTSASFAQKEDDTPFRTHTRNCQQICTLSLGNRVSSSSQLGCIYRVATNKGRVPSITADNVHNWLAYACIDIHLHAEKYAADTSTLVRLSKKLNIQPVLLVPPFQLELINDHFWPTRKGETPGIPKVECSLTSQFSGSISVTTSVDHYLFLHDLVKAYIEYLEKHQTALGRSPIPSPSVSPDLAAHSLPQSPPSSSPSSFLPPHRNFVCVCWELDPHLLLLTTVSGQFNPHISWVLEKLGLKHARTTIPKWVQRGAMDPLDMVVATVVEFLVKLTATKKLQMISEGNPPSP